MEKFLCERRSTISFKDGDIFRKYYKYAKESDVLAEQKYSIAAMVNGVNCPRFINWGYSDAKKMIYSEFEFVEIEGINRHTVNLETIKMALELIDMMPACDDSISANNERLRQELLSIVSFLPNEILQEYQYLVNDLLKRGCEVMVHGDYSFENIGWDVKNNKLIVFDFQNSGYGVHSWDKSYLLSSIPNTEYANLLSDSSIELMKIATALKYGRGIRKNFEVEERKKIYEYWWR